MKKGSNYSIRMVYKEGVPIYVVVGRGQKWWKARQKKMKLERQGRKRLRGHNV